MGLKDISLKTLCNHAINQWSNWNANVPTDIHSLTNENNISMVAKITIGIIHEYPYILWNQKLSRPNRKPIKILMHCKFDEIQSHNRSKNVQWVYQCVRVLYHNVQTSDMQFKTQNHVLANQTFNQGVKLILHKIDTPRAITRINNKDHKR